MGAVTSRLKDQFSCFVLMQFIQCALYKNCKTQYAGDRSLNDMVSFVEQKNSQYYLKFPVSLLTGRKELVMKSFHLYVSLLLAA